MLNWGIGFMFLCLLQLGASAPQGSAVSKETSRAPKAKEASGRLPAMTPQSVGDEIVKFFGRKTGKELMAEKAGDMASAGAVAAKALTGQPSAKDPAAPVLKTGSVPAPPAPRVAVPQIRQEIEKILELNKKIQNVQTGRSAQLQRVQEQARIHQKILNDLEVSQKQTAGQKVPGKNALLAQEKLRIIHEETARNSQVIDELQKTSAKLVDKTTPKASAETAPKTDLTKTPAS